MKIYLPYIIIALIFLAANIFIDMGQETSASFLRLSNESATLGIMTDVRNNLPAGRYLPMLAFIGGIIGGVILAQIHKPDFWKIFSFNKDGIKKAVYGAIAGFMIIVGLRFGFGEFYKTWRFQAGIFVMEPASIVLWVYTIITAVVLARVVKK